MFGPTPGPVGLIRIWPDTVPSGFLISGDNEKTPPPSKLGEPNVTPPMNADRSFMLALKFATTAPFGVVSGIVGVLGITVITTGVSIGGCGGALLLKELPFHSHQPFAIVLT